MLWVIVKWLLGRFWIYIFALLACSNFMAILYLTHWLWPFLHSKDFSVQVSAVNILLLGIGTTSILVLAAQWRQQGAWNRVLSYHEYFRELPRRENVVMFETCLARLNITPPTMADPLKSKDVDSILNDMGTLGRELVQSARAILTILRSFAQQLMPRSSAIAIRAI